MQAWRSVESLCLTCRRVPQTGGACYQPVRAGPLRQVMGEKCPIDQRYPYYGFPVTPDSRKLRDEAERCRESALRCFIAESDCDNPKRADALWREECRNTAEACFLCSNARRLKWKKPYSVGLSAIPIVLIASVCADLFRVFGREPISHAHKSPLIIHVLLGCWDLSLRVANCLIPPHVIYYIYQA